MSISRSQHAVDWSLSFLTDRSRLRYDVDWYRSSYEGVNVLIQHDLLIHAIMLIYHQLKHVDTIVDAFVESAWRCRCHLRLAMIYDMIHMNDESRYHIQYVHQHVIPSRQLIDIMQTTYHTPQSSTLQWLQLSCEAWIDIARMMHINGMIDMTSSMRSLAQHHVTQLLSYEHIDQTINQTILRQCDRLTRDLLHDELEYDAAIMISMKLLKTYNVHHLYHMNNMLSSYEHPFMNDFDVTCSLLIERDAFDVHVNERMIELLNHVISILKRDVTSNDHVNDLIWHRYVADCCIAHIQSTVASTLIMHHLQHIESASNDASRSWIRYAFHLFAQANNTLSQLAKQEADEQTNTKSTSSRSIDDMLIINAITLREHEQARSLIYHARAHMLVPFNPLHDIVHDHDSHHDSLSSRRASLDIALQLSTSAEALLQDMCSRVLSHNSTEQVRFTLHHYVEAGDDHVVDLSHLSHPLQRNWADACMLLTMIECHRWRLHEPENITTTVDIHLLTGSAPVISRTSNSSSNNILNTLSSNVDVDLMLQPASSRDVHSQFADLERKMLARWENHYADVFTDLSIERTPSSLPYSALSWAAKAHYLNSGAQTITAIKRPIRNHHSRSHSTASVMTITPNDVQSSASLSLNRSSSLWLGLAGLQVLTQHVEQIKSRESIDRLLARRSREQRMWHQKLFGPDPLEVERMSEEMDKVANDIADLSIQESVSQLIAELEIAREQARIAALEAEAAKSKKGKAALKSPVPNSVRSAPPAVVNAEAAQRTTISTSSTSIVDPRAKSLWSDDNTEWSPLHLINWIHDYERERALLHAQSAAIVGQPAAAGQARARRQMSMASIPTDGIVDDDALDPSILLDSPFDDQPLHRSVYSHLSTTVDQALRAHQFDIVCPAALALVHLFTTRSPVLSSKYLALHLSAMVSCRLQELNRSVSSTMEQAISNKLQRLQSTGLSTCTESAIKRCVDWLEQPAATLEETDMVTNNRALAESINEATNQSISREWQSLIWPLGVEGESELSIDGWDGVYASMLVAIPSSVSVCHVLFVQSDTRIQGQQIHQRINRSIGEEGVLYISLTASTGFPLSTRFSRTVLSADHVHKMVEAQTFFAQLDNHILRALCSHVDVAPLNQSHHPLDALQDTYQRHLTTLEEIFELPLRRALIDDSSINERDIILLTDETMFSVPFEAMRQLKCAKSVCRDLSLAAFYRRCESISAEPVNRNALAVVVHTDPNKNHSSHKPIPDVSISPSASRNASSETTDPMIEAATPLLAMASCKAIVAKHSEIFDKSSGESDGARQWMAAFSHARQSGAFVCVGLGGNYLRSSIKHLADADARGVRLAVLMAHAFEPQMADHHSRDDVVDNNTLSPYELSLMLSSRGVNTLLLGLHSTSSVVGSTATRLISLSLSSQQSVAACLKQIQSCTEVPPSLAALSRQHSPVAARSQVTSPRAKNMATHLSPMHPQGKLFEFGLQSGASMEDYTVRQFDRYNTVIMGLPHWRL